MPTQITPSYHSNVGRAGPLVGNAATTTLATVGLPKGTHWVSMTARNFSTAVALGVKVSPWLTILKTQDANVTFTDYSDAAQDDDLDTLVSTSSQDTLANGDAIYVGSHVPFRGVDINVDTINDVASVLTVSYWSSTGAWVDISDSDGTDTAGDTFKQDGAVTWTVPASTLWQPNRLNGILATNVTIPSGHVQLYWTRWEFSAALTASSDQFSWHALAEIQPESRDIGSDAVDYMPLIENQSFEMACRRGGGGFGAIEYITDAGTANLVVGVGQGKRDM